MRARYLLYICLVLVVAGSQVPVLGETEYFAVFMEDKKVGHAIQSRVVANGQVTTTEEVSITISRADVPVSINTTETSIETTDGKPLGFESVQQLSMMTMKASGTVNEQGTVNLTVTSMGTEQKSTFEWPSGAVMAEGLRLIQLKKGLKEGLRYAARVFSPGILQAVETKIYVGAKQNVDLLGRVVALTEIVTTIRMPGAGEIVSTGYVDDNLRLQKNIMPAAGLQVEMIACAKEFALGENDVLELVGKMFLASPVPLENVSSVKSITYYLSPTSKAAKLMIPPTDNQSVRFKKDGSVVVTVKPVAPLVGVRFPYKGRDKTILEAMKPTRFLQSDRKEIVDLACRVVGSGKDATEAVKRIESFVGEYITEKDFSVGYASAAEVAASQQGDCSEHAVLVAAMCRAIGIPARVVTGLVYAKEFAGRKNVFGCHAWSEAYVGDKWIGLDATRAPNGFGPGHIALAAGDGDSADLLGLASTLGRFKIDKVIINKDR